MSKDRRPVWYPNPSSRTANVRLQRPEIDDVLHFHRSLPDYAVTPLISLPDVAKEVGVKNVFVKDESKRLGLPGFKALGAFYAVFRTLCKRYKLDHGKSTFGDIAPHARKERLKLLCTTDGNHGTAVAYISKLLGVQASVYVPKYLDEYTKNKLRGYGAEVTVVDGDYDQALQVVYHAAAADAHGVLIQDVAYNDYDEVPQWIVSGYMTMLAELEDQLRGNQVECSAVLVPVGCGSLAEAVTTYMKSATYSCRVVSYEPDTAACLFKSLAAGKATSIKTSQTTLTGLDCGSVSASAWPILRDHLDASLTIADCEVEQALQSLQAAGIEAGPCGAGALAALRRLHQDVNNGVLHADSTVVLLSTEGSRPYDKPLNVTIDDAVKLTQQLVQIDSSNPTLSESGVGETEIANYIAAWLEHRNIDHVRLEKTSGRPSIVARVRGTGQGKSIMFNGHIDTVSLDAMGSKALSGAIEQRNGRYVVVGRGSQDMLSGLAAAMTTLAYAARTSLKGDVIIAAVADEEDASTGTEGVLAAGWRADVGIVAEPTDMQLGAGHKGFVWCEIVVEGVAAHGSRPDEGVDAIMHVQHVLRRLDQYAATLPADPRLGKASLHCGKISGGVEVASYPASCSLTVEFRTVPPQAPESILADIEQMLADLEASIPQFKAAPPRITLSRPYYTLPLDSDFAKRVKIIHERVTQQKSDFTSLTFWCDAALMSEVGIPSIIIGPRGAGLHSKDEWVEVDSIYETENLFRAIVGDECC